VQLRDARDARHSQWWYIGYGGKRSPYEFLVPLVGGSGGGGGLDTTYQWWASGGGAGGGALLIATNGTFNHTGTIIARGGAGGYTGSHDGYWGIPNNPGFAGGGGAGGSIRILATKAIGGGKFDTYGPATNNDACGTGECPRTPFPWSVGETGRVRVETYTYDAGYQYNHTVWTRGTPFSTYIPDEPPKPPVLWVSEINGQQLPKEPSGGFGTVDGVNQYVTLDETIAPEDETTVVISGENLPTPQQKALRPTLHVFALESMDIVKSCDADMAVDENTGILTCTVTLPGGTQSNPSFPPGYSRAYARVSWN
jgi:hypothetical protein